LSHAQARKRLAANAQRAKTDCRHSPAIIWPDHCHDARAQSIRE
jgi:hypothetical protein